MYRHIQVDRTSGGLVPVPLRLPANVWRVRITAIGGDGGSSSGGSVVAPGGRGAVASGDFVLPPGSLLWVSAGVDGFDRHCYDCPEHDVADDTNGGGGGWIDREVGVPNDGGDGGAASSVEIDTGVGLPLAPIRWALLVAGAGGGGAGGRFEIGDPNTPPGGGGGGSSLIRPGGTVGLASADAEPGVIITFEV